MKSSQYIKKQFGVDIGVRQCQRLFRSLGYSHIRPQPYPSKGYEDTEERTAFKKNAPKSRKTTPWSLYTRTKFISRFRPLWHLAGTKRAAHRRSNPSQAGLRHHTVALLFRKTACCLLQSQRHSTILPRLILSVPFWQRIPLRKGRSMRWWWTMPRGIRRRWDLLRLISFRSMRTSGKA